MYKKTILVLALMSQMKMAVCDTANTANVDKSVFTHESIFVVNQPSSYEISGGAVFLRPVGAADYNVLVSPLDVNVASPALNPNWSINNITTNFNTGFTFQVRHAIANTGNDLSLNWTHLRTSNEAQTQALGSQFNGPFYDIGPEAIPIFLTQGQVNFSYDVANAGVAKNIHFDRDMDLRFFGGISGLWLQEQQTSVFRGTPNFQFSSTYTSKFNGAGLRIGIDGTSSSFYHFRAVGLLATSLLLGTQRPSTAFDGQSSFLAQAGISSDIQNITHNPYPQMVPGFDGKLGVKYEYSLSPECLVTLEGGYMGAMYINAIQMYVPANYADNSPALDIGAIFLKSLMKTVQDFSLNGPYVTASLKM